MHEREKGRGGVRAIEWEREGRGGNKNIFTHLFML